MIAALVGGSALLFLHGGAKILSNPQSFSSEEIRRIHSAGVKREAIALPGKKTEAVVGVLELALSMGCLLLAAPLAEATPARLAPKAIDREDTPPPEMPEASSALRMLRSRLVELLSEYPWLKQCIACESLIIIADAGSGKSSIASVIAFLRAILRGHKVLILDPHASINIERGIWLVGDCFEAIGDILGTQARITKPHTRSEAHSAVLDEFGSLCADKNSAAAKFASDLVGSAIRNNRKYNNHYIFLCHGRAKGQMGGEAMPSGYLESWTRKSVVLEMEADYDEWGEAVFSGRARFKPAGRDFDDDSAYTPLSIPPFLAPVAMRREFEHLFALLGMQQAEQKQAEPPSYDPRITKLIDEAIADDKLSGIKELLEGIYRTSAEVNQCTSINPLEAIESLSEEAKNLIAYCFGKGQKYVDNNGWIEGKVIRENWAKNKGILADKLKEIVREIAAAELAEIEGNKIKLRIDKNELPPEFGQV